MNCQRKTHVTPQRPSQKGMKTLNWKKKESVRSSSVAKKRQIQSQRNGSLRLQHRLRCLLSSPSQIVKQRLKKGDRIEVFWDRHSSFFRGTVVGKEDKTCTIQYDDGTAFQHDLNNFKWRFVVLDESGTETLSESMDVNFEPDELESSRKKRIGAIKVKRGRRATGEPVREAIESGKILPLQVCKRLAKGSRKLTTR